MTTLAAETIAQLTQLAEDMIAYRDKCADARTWGGPTIYPPHPIDEDRAHRDGLALQQALWALSGDT